MSAHTPGPWEVVFVGDGNLHSSIICASDPVGTPAKDIAAVWDRGGPKKASANARLIAAAPELLAALKALLFAFEVSIHDHQDSGSWQAARAAIAKATGEQA